MSENIESNSALVKSELNFGAGEQPVSEFNAPSHFTTQSKRTRELPRAAKR